MTKDEFYTKWLEAFASDISQSDIKKYVKATGNYLWHVFSWELLNNNQYLSGNEAKKTYDGIYKTGAFYIEWFKDRHTKDLTWNFETANVLDEFAEVYVVGKDFKWTYMKTHESMCGSYFLKLK